MRKFLIMLTVVAMASFLFVGCLFAPPNEAPIITSTPSLTGVIGTEYDYTVTATDVDDDPLTYAVVGATGMVISNAGVISGWTPTVAGTYAVVVTVSDGTLDTIQSFTIVVDELEPEPEPELVLVGIEVDPKTMELFEGKSDTIDSVTACYEFRSYGVILDPDDCLFLTSNSKVATVNEDGLVTAVKIGTADILVSYKGKVDTLVVTVSAVPAPKPMEIIADMPVFEIYVFKKFTVEIVANSDVDKMVNVYFTMPTGIHTVKYWDDVEGWITLPRGEEVIFGDLDSGYSLCDEKMVFKGSFREVGTYTTVVEVWTVTPNTVTGIADKVEPLCFKVISAVVEPPGPPEE